MYLWCISLLALSSVYGLSYDCYIPETPGMDRRKDTSVWSLAQFNVEWLFTEPFKECPGEGCSWNNTESAILHLETIAKRIDALDVDTIHLCEVESCDQLQELISLMDSSKGYNGYMIKGTDSYTGQNVGLLTRIDPDGPLERTEVRKTFPISGSQCGYTGESDTEGVSKHMIARFTVNEQPVMLVGAHLLSQPTSASPCAKREAQAEVLYEIMYNNTLLGNDSVQSSMILLGDLNDFDGEILDINGNKPLSQVLDIVKMDGHMQSIASLEKNETNRYTEWWDENEDMFVQSSKELSMIDHVLVSADWYVRIQNVEYYHAYETEEQGDVSYDSDHFPVIVEFAFE
jgi:exonuclease III